MVMVMTVVEDAEDVEPFPPPLSLFFPHTFFPLFFPHTFFSLSRRGEKRCGSDRKACSRAFPAPLEP